MKSLKHHITYHQPSTWHDVWRHMGLDKSFISMIKGGITGGEGYRKDLRIVQAVYHPQTEKRRKRRLIWMNIRNGNY